MSNFMIRLCEGPHSYIELTLDEMAQMPFPGREWLRYMSMLIERTPVIMTLTDDAGVQHPFTVTCYDTARSDEQVKADMQREQQEADARREGIRAF